MTTRNGSATYPRAFVRLSITNEDGVSARDEIRTGIIPAHVSVTRRSHNQAGECTVTVNGSAMPFDPRHVAGVAMAVYLGDPGAIDGDVERREFLRFVGFVDELHPVRDEHGPSVELKARDFSSILRDFHPIPREVVPRYSMTVGEAIENILSVTPGALNGDGSQRVRLRQVEGVTDRPLRHASHVRGQRAAMRLPRETTAWQAIEYLCGTLSLLVSVQLDEIIVREATDAFANTKSPGMRFIFGGPDANLLSVETTKRFVRNRKGVKVTSYNPATRETLTAVYPPDADTLRIARPHTHLGGAVIARISGRHGRRRSGGRGPHRPAGAEIDRDVFPANGITSQDELARYAERIYTERSRQEIDGKIVSPVWTNDTLSLDNADRIEIEIEPDLASEIRSMDINSAARMLERRLHVDADAARVLVRAAIYRPTDTWYAREVTAEFEGGGRSTVSVDFINLIRLTP